VEPELGACVVTVAGPIIDKPLNTRAQRIQRARTNDDEPLLQPGTHFTLMYRHMSTGAEHFSSVTEVVRWIAIGPLLPPPAPTDVTIHDNPTGGVTNENTRKQRVPTLDDNVTQRQEQRVAARSYDANGDQTKRPPDQDTRAPHTAKRLRTKSPNTGAVCDGPTSQHRHRTVRDTAGPRPSIPKERKSGYEDGNGTTTTEPQTLSSPRRDGHISAEGATRRVATTPAMDERRRAWRLRRRGGSNLARGQSPTLRPRGAGDGRSSIKSYAATRF
jgi:hypothetical protein